MAINDDVQKVVFEKGLQYGTLIHDSLQHYNAFAPMTLLTTPYSKLVTPYAPVTFRDELAILNTNMKTFINRGTAAYVAELAYGMIHDVGGVFTQPEFAAGMEKLIADLEGYQPETMLKIVFDVPVTDFISMTYNTDCHWVDYSRKLMFQNIFYAAPSLVALDAISLELFPRYRQYAMYRQNADPQAKRIAAATFVANANIHYLVYGSISQFRPEYGNRVFLSCIDEMSKMLFKEANIAMLGIET